MHLMLQEEPVAKARHRSSVQKGRVRTYDVQAEQKIATRWRLKEALREADDLEVCRVMGAKALSVEFMFYLPLASGCKGISRDRKLLNIELHTSRPDYDNLSKYYLDCMNGVVWKDDCLVVEGFGSKRYAEDPRVEISITVLRDKEIRRDIERIVCVMKPIDMLELYRMIEDKKDLIQNLCYGRRIPSNEELGEYCVLVSRVSEMCADELAKIKNKNSCYYQVMEGLTERV